MMTCSMCKEEMSDRPEEQHGFSDSYYDEDGGLHLLEVTHPDGFVWVTSFTAEYLVRVRAGWHRMELERVERVGKRARRLVGNR